MGFVMKAILVLDVEADCPLGLLENENNLILEVIKSGMVWKPIVNHILVMPFEKDEKKALPSFGKAISDEWMTSNMGMSMDMSME